MIVCSFLTWGGVDYVWFKAGVEVGWSRSDQGCGGLSVV